MWCSVAMVPMIVIMSVFQVCIPFFIFSYASVYPSGKKIEFELFFEQYVVLGLVERFRDGAPDERDNRKQHELLIGC